MNTSPPSTEILARRAEAAWDALQRQYGNRVSEAELDHLFACFVLGLTSPAYGERKPGVHFDICRALVATKLAPDRARAALHSVPEPSEPWVASARELIENRGEKIGRQLEQGSRSPDDVSAADVDSRALERSGNSEDKLQ